MNDPLRVKASRSWNNSVICDHTGVWIDVLWKETLDDEFLRTITKVNSGKLLIFVLRIFECSKRNLRSGSTFFSLGKPYQRGTRNENVNISAAPKLPGPIAGYYSVAQQTVKSVNDNYNRILESDWLSEAMIRLFITSILKSLVILAIWLALNSAIYFVPNNTLEKITQFWLATKECIFS